MTPNLNPSLSPESNPINQNPEDSFIFVAINPVAGRNRRPESLTHCLELLASSGSRIETFQTTGNDEDLHRAVSSAIDRGAHLIVAAGGDGTIAATAEGLLGCSKDHRLGILPTGTGNVLARELEIPLDLEEACSVLLESDQLQAIDVMRVGERHFLFQVGIGLDSLMIEGTTRQQKRKYGRIAYLWTACKRLIGYEPLVFSLWIDQTKRIRVRASEILIANGGTIGELGWVWGANIRLDDQTLKVCAVRAKSVLDYLSVFFAFFSGKPEGNSHIRYFEVHDHIVVASDHPMPVQADGEIIGHTPVKVEIIPSAISIVVPKESE